MSDLVVNGTPVSIEGWYGRRLLDYLRLGLGLTGAKEGCGEAECGACTVLVDGEPVCSCLVPTDTVRGCVIRTVEGLDPDFVAAFAELAQNEGGVQCGFCTSGITVMAQWIADGGTETGSESITKLLEGNLCRCTGYVQLERVLNQLCGKAEPKCTP